MASTTFQQIMASSGEYLWNNASNWTSGIPINGDDVIANSLGYDNVASLDLGNLNLGANGDVNVLGGSSLTVNTVSASTFGGSVAADTLTSGGGTATVTIGTVTWTGWNYYAEGAGATLIADSLVASGGPAGNNFTVSDGGTIELMTAPVNATALYYQDGTGTIELKAPAATTSELLSGLSQGDVLELPGKSVSSVIFGTNSLDITTSAGTYDFTNVSYASSIDSYAATVDPKTGLVAIAFGNPDTFQQSVATSGEYLWNNASNWTAGGVVSGDSVTSNSTGYDNIASLDLGNLNLGASGAVNVLGGSSLTVNTVSASTFGGSVAADTISSGGGTATVTIGTVTWTGWNYYAEGAGATLIADSLVAAGGPAGNNFTVSDGGTIELMTAPVNATALYYQDGTGTIELKAPAATTSEQLSGVSQGDVLELPGKSVSNVVFGTNSLDITTSAGSYDFTNVSYASSIDSYAAMVDPKTGLVAIAFGSPDTFQQSVATSGEYLWSNASNWTAGAVVSGDSVTSNSLGYDNIASLDLANLTLGASGQVHVLGGSSLTVNTVSASTYGGSVAADTLTSGGGTATVTIGTVTWTGWNYYAEGAGATLVADSLVAAGGPAGNNFTAYDGGTIELLTAPVNGTALYYEDGTGTIELKAPAATTSEQLSGVSQGDVLELPGKSVSSVVFGTNSLDITTSAGTYDFTDVSYGDSVFGYTATQDSSTGLEAITFTEGNFISTAVHGTLTVGSTTYPSPLTITASGSVIPKTSGATAVVSSRLTGSLTNNGTVRGSTGAASTDGAGGNGGFGVDLTAGKVWNLGSITGGKGGAGITAGGNGGAAVNLDGGTLTTSGSISGGAGGKGTSNGTAGVAVQFGTAASTLVVENGAAFGGAIAGFGSSDNVEIANLTPIEVAADFNPTTHVLTTPSDGTLHFSGAFSDEYFVFSADGATGTDITLATGSGISTTLTSTVTVGSAANPSPLTITATGVVAPTTNDGAAGVVSNVSTDTLTTSGTIQGDTGYYNPPGVGGTGGFGVNLRAGTVTNSGSITGGTGGQGTTGGNGGAGVDLNGGTLNTSGTISGGAAGSGTSSDGTLGDAVQFGTAASTLIVDPGAVFDGQVVANNTHDVLKLSGSQVGGTPIALGTQFNNFATLNFASGAAWTVDATKGALQAPHTMLTLEGFTTSDTLDITNFAAAGATLSFNASTEILAITKGATTVDLGFTSAFAGEHFVFTPNGIGGDLTLQANAPSPGMALSVHDHLAGGFAGHGLAHALGSMLA